MTLNDFEATSYRQSRSVTVNSHHSDRQYTAKKLKLLENRNSQNCFKGLPLKFRSASNFDCDIKFFLGKIFDQLFSGSELTNSHTWYQFRVSEP